MAFVFLLLSAALLFSAFRGGMLSSCGVSRRLFGAFLFLSAVGFYPDVSLSFGWLILHPVRIACAALAAWYFLSCPMSGWMRYRAVLTAVLYCVPLYFLRQRFPEETDAVLAAAPYLFSGAAAILSFALCPIPEASVGCCALSCLLTEFSFALAEHAVSGGTAEAGGDPFSSVLLSGLLLSVLLNDLLTLWCERRDALAS